MKHGPSSRDQHIKLNVNGVQREYLLHVPNKLLDMPLPLVMLLHGTGGSVNWTQEEANFNRFANRAGFVAVYPQGLPPDPAQPTKFLANPPMWNVGSMLFPHHAPDDISFIQILLEDVAARTKIDRQRIYVTGFSNGAAMCFELAAQLGDRISAIAPIAGYCRLTSIIRAVPTLYIIGADDPMVPPFGGNVTSPWTGEVKQRPSAFEGLDRWAELLGCSTNRTVLHDQNGIRIEQYPGPVEFQVMIVEGLGHHWPGGRGRLKKKLAGEPSKRLDGNSAIWQFFQRHQLP